jgi:hypothetical protein
MKNFISKLLLFSGVVFLLQGCSLNDDGDQYCYNRFYMAATAVTGPVTAVVNTDAEFQVTFPIANSCGEFFDFAQLNTVFPREIAAAVDYTGCNCNEVATQVTKTYKFKATVPGTYVLHFLTEDENAPIVKTIEITAQ